MFLRFQHYPIGTDKAERDNQQRKDFHEVGKTSGVLKRVRRVGAEDATTIGSQQFNCLLASYRSARNIHARGAHQVGPEGLHGSAQDEDEGNQ